MFLCLSLEHKSSLAQTVSSRRKKKRGSFSSLSCVVLRFYIIKVFFLCRYENEQPFRKAVEDEINSLYKVIDDANLTKMDLESQIESMKEELTLLSKNHEEVSPGSRPCPAPVYLSQPVGITSRCKASHKALRALAGCGALPTPAGLLSSLLTESTNLSGVIKSLTF